MERGWFALRLAISAAPGHSFKAEQHGRRYSHQPPSGAAQADHHAQKETSTAGFRRLLREISTLLCYEVTRDLELTMETIETPLEEIQAPVLEGKKLVFASILRAGNGLLEGMLDLVPSARVAHIGVYRDHETLEAIEYYFKAPEDVSNRLIIVVDPMLATGNSSIASIEKLKERARAISGFSACWQRRKVCATSRRRTRMCRSTPPRSTAISMSRAILFPVWAMPATACTAPSKPARKWFPPIGKYQWAGLKVRQIS